MLTRDPLRDRIAAALKAQAEFRGIYKIADFDFQFLADAVIRELDDVLVDWGLWLAEEITGRTMTRLGMESCLTDWKANDE